MTRKTAPKTDPQPQPSSLETLRKHRIVRVRRQNEKLALDLKKAKGEWVELESIKREVLAANAVVKSQLLSLPFRLGSQLASIANPRECSLILVKAIEECLNDLAYSRETPPETCPTCGAGVEKRS